MDGRSAFLIIGAHSSFLRSQQNTVSFDFAMIPSIVTLTMRPKEMGRGRRCYYFPLLIFLIILTNELLLLGYEEFLERSRR